MRTLYVETNDVISWVIRQQGESQNVFQKKKKKKKSENKNENGNQNEKYLRFC